MQNDLRTLMDVQAGDQSIARLEQQIKEIPARIAALESKKNAAQLRVKDAEQKLALEETARRRLDSDIRDQQQRISKFRDQTSSVKNNEQFHALQHEISFAENEIRRIEDKQLESMEKSETLDQAKKLATSDLSMIGSKVEEEKKAGSISTERDQLELASLRKNREQLRSGVDPALLSTYDRVAAARKTGVAGVQGQQCLACHVMLRPQRWNEVRAGGVSTCESCGRLLYFDPAKEPAPPAKSQPATRPDISEVS